MMLGILALLIVYLIGGALSPTFVKLGVSEIPPIIFTGLRYLIATLVFFPFFLAVKNRNLSKTSLIELSSLSVFFFLNVLLFSFAISKTTVIMSQILYAFVPVFVAIISFFLLKERVTKNQIIGGSIAAFGLFLLIFQSLIGSDALSLGTALGNILCLGGVASWSLYLAYSKKLTTKYPPSVTAFYNFVFTMIFMFAISPVEWGERINVNSISVISVLGAGILSSALMIFLLQYGIKKTSAITASLFSYTGPFFASIAGILVFGERITPTLLIGGLLIISGVFYATTLPYLTNLRLKYK